MILFVSVKPIPEPLALVVKKKRKENFVFNFGSDTATTINDTDNNPFVMRSYYCFDHFILRFRDGIYGIQIKINKAAFYHFLIRRYPEIVYFGTDKYFCFSNSGFKK